MPKGDELKVYELRDLNEVRRFLLQGLWLQRVLPAGADTVRAPLEWSLEIASEGYPLPPPGFVADLGHVAFGKDWEARANRDERPLPGLPVTLLRGYEDHVLGKIYADWTFAEASDYLRTYKGRDQMRGLAFVVNQFRQRAGFAGVDLPPSVIKTLLELAPDVALAQGWEMLERDGLQPLLGGLYQSLIVSARRTAEVLDRVDLFELNRRTALDEFGQRLALRQVLQAAHHFEDALPQHRIRPLAGRQEVPTRVLDEDTYPVGGFSSLSTRGTVESLLHSQLAYMEKDERPDLFDVKYLRDELLYYSRDENQFLRRRRLFAFVLPPDLIHTRFKDATLPYQRVVLLWALLYVTVRKLSEWLSTDALTFVFYFLAGPEPTPLGPELALLRTLLREQIENGTVEVVEKATLEQVAAQCSLRARRSLCHCLTVSTTDLKLHAQDTAVTRLRLDAPCPALGVGDDPVTPPEVEDALEGWHAVLEQLLQRWI